MMKRLAAAIITITIGLTTAFGSAAMADAQEVSWQVSVYDTDGEGLALKERPDINSDRYCLIFEDEVLDISSIQDGWGYTVYQGQPGWVALRYTRAVSDVISQTPEYGFITPLYYTVYDTDGEGLELRAAPTVDAVSFGPIPEGTAVLVEAVEGEWAYTCYDGHYGWAYTAYLNHEYYQASVYNTDGEGLALKAQPDLDSQRYFLIPEQTVLDIDGVTGDGWGHTSLHGYTGWVALRYTKVEGEYPTKAPVSGYITPDYYTVVNTDGEGLELRTKPSVHSSTFGPIAEGTSVLLEAVDGAWAYTSYNGHLGWVYLEYLQASEVWNVNVLDVVQGMTLGRSGLTGAARSNITFGADGNFVLGGDVLSQRYNEHSSGSGQFIHIQEIYEGIYEMEMSGVTGSTQGWTQKTDGTYDEYLTDLSELNGDLYYLILPGAWVPETIRTINVSGSDGTAQAGYTIQVFDKYLDENGAATQILLWKCGTDKIYTNPY